MRWRAFLFFFLLFTIQSTAFVEYSYLLKSGMPSLYYLLLSPQSCDGFLNTNATLANNLRDDSEYGEALSYAEGAVHELDNAKASAVLQRIYQANTLAPVYYRVYSFACFSHGANALGLSLESAKTAVKTLDKNAEEFSLKADDSYSGYAGGMVRELAEASSDIEQRKTQGEGFGKLFVRYANENDKVLAHLSDSANAAEVIAGINRMIGQDSLVSETIKFDGRIKQAEETLEEEEFAAQEDYAAKLRLAENKRDFLKAEGLAGISETAFVLVGSASGLYSEYAIGSFEQDLRAVDENIENAKATHAEAERIMKAKQKAYASRSISKLNSAVSLLENTIQLMKGIDERSSLLEEKLRARVLVEQSRTRDAVEKTQNAYAAARAQNALEKNIGALVSALRTRGERISFYLREIDTLQDIQRQAAALNPAQEEKDRLLAGIKTVKTMIEKAERDGVDVNFEKTRLKDFESAANALGTDAQSQARAITLESDLQDLADSIVAIETAEYASLLERYFQRVSKIQKYLNSATQTQLDSLNSFFSYNGRLDVRSSMGKLKEARQVFENALAEIDLKAPNLLKRSLEESAVIIEETGVARLGLPVTSSVSVSLKNFLDLDYEGQIALDLKLPEDLVVSEKSENAAFASGRVYLRGIKADGGYFLKGTYSKVFAVLESESSETIFANEQNARKKLSINFKAEKPVEVFLEKTFPPLAFAAVDSKAAFEKSVLQSATETRIGIIVQATAGKNAVEITYEPAQAPFAIKRETLVQGNSTVLLYDIQNVFEDLESASLSEVQEIPCEPLSAKVESEMKATATIANRLLFITIETGAFRKSERKIARVLVHCSGVPDSFQPADFNYNYSLATSEFVPPSQSQAEISIVEQACAKSECGTQARGYLTQAKAFQERGFYAKAFELAGKAKEQAAIFQLKEQKTDEEKRALVSEYPVLKDALEKASGDFNRAFAVEQSLEATRKKTLQYQEGLALIKTAEKALATLKKPFEKQGKGESLSNYTNEFLLQYAQEANESVFSLQSVVESTSQRAAEEINLAAQRQKQFGTSETQLELESAQADLQAGKVFSAWMAASALNRKLVGAPRQEQAGFDYSLLLGAAGVIIIFALAFVFFKRGKPLLEEF